MTEYTLISDTYGSLIIEDFNRAQIASDQLKFTGNAASYLLKAYRAEGIEAEVYVYRKDGPQHRIKFTGFKLKKKGHSFSVLVGVEPIELIRA